jgi:ADP-ribose pyrophosphatase
MRYSKPVNKQEANMTDNEKIFFDLALKVATLGRPSVSEILARYGYFEEAKRMSLMEESCPTVIKIDIGNDSEKVVYSNPWFQIVKNGKYHFMREKNSNQSAVVLVESDGCYLFVNQYRHSLGKEMLELPRGSAKDNETSAQCAMREVLEESGILLKSEDIIKIGTVCPNSGVMASEVSVFFAKTSRSKAEFTPYSDGIKNVILIPKDKVLGMIASHEIKDAFSISALMLFYAFNKGSW